MDFSFFDNNKIIPVVVIDNVDDTPAIIGALKKGGINVAEITFRTDCAEQVLSSAAENFKEMLIGAGTVINARQCRRAIELGAKFIVSPGYDEGVSDECKSADIPYIPGVATPTEIICAKNAGWNILKFFPAEAYGGIKTLKALSAPFPDVRFVPTGGIDDKNMSEYLAKKFVVAVGGSWMMNGSLEEICSKSAKAVAGLTEIQK